MRRFPPLALLTAGTLASVTCLAVQLNGTLPMYPNGHNMNDMPASVIAMGVPMVLETSDSVPTVDSWYTSHAPKSCVRSAQSGKVKYACPGGSIMIYAHGSATQVAFVPAMPHF